MISKTKISKRTKKKTDKSLVETIIKLKKYNHELASKLAVPTRKRIALNLDEISRESKDGETIIVPGKVLGTGKIDKKIKIIALNFSKQAEEKIKKAKLHAETIKEALEKNKKIEGKIIR